MIHFRTKLLFTFISSLLLAETAHAQSIGINTSGATANSSSMLDIDVSALTTKKGLLIPRMTSAQKTAMNPLPAAAQGLVIYQTDGVEGFYYNSSTTTVPNWIYLVSSSTGSWLTTGNSGTTASTAAIGSTVNNNFIGTTDAKDFVFASNNLERMRILSTGQIGIGVVPSGNKLHVVCTNGSDNALFADHQSSSTTLTYYGVGATLSSFGTTLGYLAYHNSSNVRYAVYGNGGDLAGYFNGLVGINSTPTALTTNDLEVRNNTAGATAVNVAMRQTTSLTASGSVLTNLNFGDNHQTGAEAQLQVIRSAVGGAGDLPTSMLFYTTPDGSATLTERMRLTHAGYLGIGGTPLTSLDVNGAISARFSNAAAAATITIPTNVTLFRITATAGVQANAVSETAPQDGQILVIINEDDNAATLTPGSYAISALASGIPGVGTFVYSSTAAAWRQIASMPASSGGSGWALTGNSGTDGGATNFIGTTDAKALSFRVGGSGTGFRSGLIDISVGGFGFPNADGCTFFGYQSGKNATPGSSNWSATAVGYKALTVLNGGTHNSAFGNAALAGNIDGFSNTAVGSKALLSNVSGGQNTAVGVNALYSNAGDGSITGLGNTAIGFQAMYFNSTGNYNTALGYESYMSNTFSNCMTLGSDASGGFLSPTGNNQVWIGDNGITSIKGQVAFGTYSDARIKNNVRENVPGLEFINALRPVTYNYDYNKEVQLSGGKKSADWEGKYDIEKIRFSGFLAQEVEAAAKKIGYDFSGVDAPKNGKGLYSLRYSEFVVPLVKSVQELDEENKKLKEQMSVLAEDNKEIRAELDEIKSLLEAKNK
jgi:hypothetical protein